MLDSPSVDLMCTEEIPDLVTSMLVAVTTPVTLIPATVIKEVVVTESAVSATPTKRPSKC